MEIGGPSKRLRRAGDGDGDSDSDGDHFDGDGADGAGDFRPWADLPPDLLLLVACHTEGFCLKDYRALRGVCAPWRSTVGPVSPSFSFVASCTGGGTRFNAAFTLPSQLQPLELSLGLERRVLLPPVEGPGADRSIVVGASGGWVAVHERFENANPAIVLANPLSGKKILLPLWRDVVLQTPTRRSCKSSDMLVTKMVFAPNPTAADFTAVAICTYNTLVYAKSGYWWWMDLVLTDLIPGDMLADLLYHAQDGKIYCVTELGNVHVVTLPDGRRRGMPTVENLLPASALPFEPGSAAYFAPPFCTVNESMTTKNLVFCGGGLYQVWRNAICTRTSPLLPDGTRCRVLHNDIFVLRYHPGSSPCWKEAKELGGYSVFVGKNNAVAVHPGDVAGVRANCVYWIGGSGRDHAMVFDMATRTSTPYIEPGRLRRQPQQAICWYFMN